MGRRQMPTAPMYLDSFGMPLTRLVATPLAGVVAGAPATPVQPPPQAAAATPLPSALDIANAALAAAYGTPSQAAAAPAAPMGGGAPTRVLVLSNMVMQEDLQSDEDYQGLQEEVREECAKFGTLKGMQIPRRAEGNIQQSAILKIFLEYASVQDAQAAERELKGRKFGDNVVQVCVLYCDTLVNENVRILVDTLFRIFVLSIHRQVILQSLNTTQDGSVKEPSLFVLPMAMFMW